MDKALGYMALARKAGLIELGEEPAGTAAATGKARLILVAADAADHTWRRAKSFAADGELPCIRVVFTKDQLGQATGRTSLALAAFTDPAMALAFVKALNDPQNHAQALTKLEEQAKAQNHSRQRGGKKGRSHPAAKKEH